MLMIIRILIIFVIAMSVWKESHLIWTTLAIGFILLQVEIVTFVMRKHFEDITTVAKCLGILKARIDND